MNDYYVYVYIDPRNNEEFYYGKGCGSRKKAHLRDTSDTEKARRVKAIHDAGLRPVIRVIARDLSEHDALLVEKTLLWKLGKQLTNKSSGHYAAKFRPHDNIHRELSGFDFQHGLYYYNVGEGPQRNWDDYKKYGIISAGQGIRWRNAILGFQQGDAFAAFLKGYGFVGIGLILEPAKPIRDVMIGKDYLLSLPLSCEKKMASNVGSDKLCEYVCTVKWIRKVDRDDAKWEPKSGLFTTPLVRASLDGQLTTIKYLEHAFRVNLGKYVS